MSSSPSCFPVFIGFPKNTGIRRFSESPPSLTLSPSFFPHSLHFSFLLPLFLLLCLIFSNVCYVSDAVLWQKIGGKLKSFFVSGSSPNWGDSQIDHLQKGVLKTLTLQYLYPWGSWPACDSNQDIWKAHWEERLVAFSGVTVVQVSFTDIEFSR